MSSYVIEGGQQGKARLAVLAQVLAPTTNRLLDQVGVRSGMRALDLGCGGGNVTCELARRVGSSGQVVGIDRDAVVLDLARQDAVRAGLTWIAFRQADATGPLEKAAFDVAYIRFLLTHVSQPRTVLENLKRSLRPGGMLIVEDIDFTGHVCQPPCPAFVRYQELYREVVRRRGGDADIGPKLPLLLQETGFVDVEVQLAQPVGLQGDVKTIAGLTLQRVADTVIAEKLASAAEVAALLAELAEYAADPRTLMSLPRIFQVWGH